MNHTCSFLSIQSILYTVKLFCTPGPFDHLLISVLSFCLFKSSTVTASAFCNGTFLAPRGCWLIERVVILLHFPRIEITVAIGRFYQSVLRAQFNWFFSGMETYIPLSFTFAKTNIPWFNSASHLLLFATGTLASEIPFFIKIQKP